MLNVQDDFSSFEQALAFQNSESQTLHRSQTYMIKFNSSLFLVVDTLAIIVKPATIAVALDMLLKSFYVFNVQYPKQTVVVHTLLWHTVLGIEGRLSSKAMKLFSELQL